LDILLHGLHDIKRRRRQMQIAGPVTHPITYAWKSTEQQLETFTTSRSIFTDMGSSVAPDPANPPNSLRLGNNTQESHTSLNAIITASLLPLAAKTAIIDVNGSYVGSGSARCIKRGVHSPLSATQDGNPPASFSCFAPSATSSSFSGRYTGSGT
jgi:hypothetical protein